MKENKRILDDLIANGQRLHLGFLIEYGFFNWVENIHEMIREKKPLSFRFSYEDWYSESLGILSQHKPTYLEEFIHLYRDEKQEVPESPVDVFADFLLGNEIRRSHDYSEKVNAVKRNFESQLKILVAIK